MSSSAFSNFKLYRYTPSLAGAIVAACIFLILTITHGVRMSKSKSFYFTPFLIGGIFETVGYCGRIWSHFSPESVGGFVTQALTILVAPALFAASIYMTLKRLMHATTAEHLSLLPARWVTRIFVTSDVISFSLQAGGGGIQSAGTLQAFNIGEKIIVAGLLSQILGFGCFVVTTSVFHIRMNKHVQRSTSTSTTSIPWRKHLSVLYISSGLILIRSIFRVVEYLQGNAGYLISHEIFLYMLDTLLMIAVMAVFAVWYIDDLNRDRASSSTSSADKSNPSDYSALELVNLTK